MNTLPMPQHGLATAKKKNIIIDISIQTTNVIITT